MPPRPDPGRAVVAVAAPGDGSGFWAGGPSAAVDPDGTVYLAYRLRRPVGEGRGFAVAIARSTDGGESFEEISRLPREDFDCDSLERPALVRRPDGAWRLYLSLATPGTLNWHVVAIDAEEPGGFDPRRARSVLRGGPGDAFKDTVVHVGPRGWEMWACRHRVADPTTAAEMTTVRATSADGIDWTLEGTVLAPSEPSAWDGRGTRLTAVIDVGDRRFAYYDGRASYAENWEERTGVAVENGDGSFTPLTEAPVGTSPHRSGSLRYVDAVRVEDGLRLYYEASRPDGAHDLYTELVSDP